MAFSPLRALLDHAAKFDHAVKSGYGVGAAGRAGAPVCLAQLGLLGLLAPPASRLDEPSARVSVLLAAPTSSAK
jgi:hypothetical protein